MIRFINQVGEEIVVGSDLRFGSVSMMMRDHSGAEDREVCLFMEPSDAERVAEFLELHAQHVRANHPDFSEFGRGENPRRTRQDRSPGTR